MTSFPACAIALPAMAGACLLLAACGDSTPPTEGFNPSLTVVTGNANVNLAVGGTASTAVSVQRTGGYSGAVSLSVTGQPSTVTATVSPTTLGAGQSSASITWTAVGTAAPGTHAVTITATGSGVSAASTSAQLVIVAPAPATTIQRVAGDGQTVTSGSAVPVKPSVMVRDAAGQPLAGVVVTFAMDTGAGALVDSVVTSGSDGIATIGSWSPGPGRSVLRATTGSLAPVRFAATGVGEQTLVSAPIPAGGGTLTISQPGPLDGLTLTIPSGAFPTSQTMSVSYGNETGVPSKPGLRIVSPVITITSSAGGFANGGPMTLRIPATFKSNEWPVALLFDRTTGKLSVLPSTPVDTTGVIAVTRHLDASFLDPDPEPAVFAALRTGPVARRANASVLGARSSMAFGHAAAQIHPSVQLVIGAVTYEALSEDLDSEYRSETDDWEFDPAIIYDAQDRFFNALPLTAAWYFDHFKHGGGALAGRFREAEGVALSNAQGLRLGPMVTSNIDLEAVLGMFGALIRETVESKLFPDSVALLYIKSGLYLTGRPQVLIGLSGNDAEPATMLLVYRTRGSVLDVTVGTRAAGISAPRSIALEGGKQFGSTMWGARTIYDEQKSYTASNYVPTGQTAGMNAKTLNAAWQHVFAGTAGDANLPTYHLASREESEVADTIFIAEDTTRVWFECPTCELGLTPGEGITPAHKLAGGVRVERIGGTWAGDGRKLVEGDGLKIEESDDGKHLGFVVFNVAEANGLVSYLDWVEVEVRKRTLTVTPEESNIGFGDDVTLTATLDEGRPMPPNPTWEWEMGDGRTLTGRGEELIDAYNFVNPTEKTTYKVVARLFSDGKLFASGKAEVTVSPAGPFWKITSISGPREILEVDEGEQDADEFALLRRVLDAPGAGVITIEENGNATELRLRVLRNSLWNPEQCCPLAALNPNTEWLLPLGYDPAISRPVGPFFAGWGTSHWSQTVESLSEGTVTGQYVKSTFVVTVKDQGAQSAPQGGIRFTGTRSGKLMTGELSLTIWGVDSESGEVEDGPTTYRWPFTAERLR